MRDEVNRRYPFFRSTFFERRMLFERLQVPPKRSDQRPDLRIVGDTMTCSAPQSSLDALLKQVSRHQVVDFECSEAELEETFLTYYEANHVA